MAFRKTSAGHLLHFPHRASPTENHSVVDQEWWRSTAAVPMAMPSHKWHEKQSRQCGGDHTFTGKPALSELTKIQNTRHGWNLCRRPRPQQRRKTCHAFFLPLRYSRTAAPWTQTAALQRHWPVGSAAEADRQWKRVYEKQGGQAVMCV